MLLNHWNGKDFKKLEQPISQLTHHIARQGQLQLAYPVVLYFHSDEKLTALLPNLAAMDEALSTLLLYVPAHHRRASEMLYQTRKAITSFLSYLQDTFIHPSEEKAPSFELEGLARAGIPLLKPTKEDKDCLELRRRVLKSMLLNDGRSWEDFSNSTFNRSLDLRLLANEG